MNSRFAIRSRAQICRIAALCCLSGLATPALPAQTAFTNDADGNRTGQSVIAAPSAPTLVTAPTDQVGRLNGTARFVVVAGGTGPFTYQWFAGASPIVGATSDTLALTNLTTGDFTPAPGGTPRYTVQVTNAHSSITSAPAALYRDTTGRGLADWWQQQYFGNLNVDPNADADGDGVSNGQEFRDGTSPIDAGSRAGRLTLRGPASLVSAFPGLNTYSNGSSVTARGTSFGELQFGGWTGSLRSAESAFSFNFGSGGDYFLSGLFGAMPTEKNAPAAVFGNASAAPASIFNFAAAPDGSVVVCGTFDRLNDQTRRFVARLLPGGAADPSFAPVANASVFNAAVQPDGKIILIGSFTQLNGQNRPGVARVLANGALDPSFAPADQGANISQVSTVAIQRDGKILVGGVIWTGSGFETFVRFNANGTRDATFAPGLNGAPSSIALQPDAKIVVGGGFSFQNGTTPVPRLVRLLPNGTLDPAFSASTTDGVTTQPATVLVQPDGRILAGGAVQIRLNGNPVTLPVIRLNANGTLDTSFTQRITAVTPVPTFSALALQDDGRIVGVGTFAMTKPDVVNALRFEADGSIDPDAFVISRPNAPVTAVAAQSDGSLIVGGSFVSVTPREGPMNSHRYLLTAGRKGWFAAEAEARASGGNLVTVNGPRENDFVALTLLPAAGLERGTVWLGLTDHGVEGQFAWSSGEPVTYTNWYPGQPNNNGNQDYTAMNGYYAYDGTGRGTWEDAEEGGSVGYGPAVDGPWHGLIEVNPAASVPSSTAWVAGRDLARNERAGAAQELTNPNGTVPEWSYGIANSLTSPTLSLYLPTEHVNNASGTEGWVRPLYASVLVNARSSGYVGPSGVARPEEMVLHPPPTGFVAVRWTAPSAGTYAVSAFWQDLDWNGGDGGQAGIVRNGADVIFNVNFDSGGGPTTTHILALAAGDTLDFMLGPRANDLADSARFNAIVKLVPNAASVWVAGRDLVANEKPDGGAQETQNPNPTVPAWSYGYRSTVVSSGYTLYSGPGQHLNSGNGSGPDDAMEGWAVGNAWALANTGSTPVIHNYGAGPNLPFYPGEMLVSPGGNGGPFPVVRWTAPAAGTYDIFAWWQDSDFHGGNGASAHIVVNGGQVYGQEIDNGHGASTLQTLTLAAGDQVDFTMGTRGEAIFDTAKFNAVILGPGTAPRPTPPVVNAVTPVASRLDLVGNAAIDWASAGPNNTSFLNPFGVTASNGAAFRVSKGTEGAFQRLTQGSGWVGNFAPGDAVLNHANSDGPVRITAAERSGVFSTIGLQIMPNQNGAFTATLQAYDVDGALLGSTTVNGTGNANADNSAVFLGLRSDLENIHSVSIDTNTVGSGGDFAINHVSLVMTPAANGDLALTRNGFARLVTTNLLSPGTLGIAPAGPIFATGASASFLLAPQTSDAPILEVRLERSADGFSFADAGVASAAGGGSYSRSSVLPPGQSFYRALVTDSRQQQRRSFAVGPVFTPPAVTSALTANGSVQLPFTYEASATGPLTAFTATGLPAWATAAYDANTGLLTIAGTPIAPGAFAVTLQPTNVAGSTPTVLTIFVANRFSAWQNANFTAGEIGDPNLGGPLGNVTSNGIANLLRYALGIPARQTSSAGLPTISIQTYGASKHATLTYRRDRFATDVTLAVQVSANLTSWTSGPSFTTEVSRIDQGDGTEIVVTRDNVPVAGTTHRFLRLQVSP